MKNLITQCRSFLLVRTIQFALDLIPMDEPWARDVKVALHDALLCLT